MAASTFRLGRRHCPSVGPTWPGSARCATTRAVQTTDPYTHGTDVDLPRSAGSILSRHTVTCLLQVVWREQWHCEPLLISLVCGELPTVWSILCYLPWWPNPTHWWCLCHDPTHLLVMTQPTHWWWPDLLTDDVCDDLTHSLMMTRPTHWWCLCDEDLIREVCFMARWITYLFGLSKVLQKSPRHSLFGDQNTAQMNCRDVCSLKLQLHHCPSEGCNYACPSKNGINSHLLKHAQSDAFACEVCGKTFKRQTYVSFCIIFE